MRYLIDSAVFIQAKNQHYGFDICPAFWEWLVAKNAAGAVFSVEKIGGELTAGRDPLATWATAQGAGFFLPPDAAVTASMVIVSAWASSSRRSGAAVAKFLTVGDFYLVSHAHAHGHKVVTHEVPSNSPNKIKIPDACDALGIKHSNPYQMLRDERASFVLAAPVTAGVAAVAPAPPAPGPGAGIVLPPQGPPANP